MPILVTDVKQRYRSSVLATLAANSPKVRLSSFGPTGGGGYCVRKVNLR